MLSASGDESEQKLTRRAFVALSVSLSTALLGQGAARSDGELQLHSEFSELAAKIPGVGQSDVYYPEALVGEWVVARVLYDVAEMGAPVRGDHAVLSTAGIARLRSEVGVRREYRVRFVRFRGHIVEDRAAGIRAEIGGEVGGRVDATWSADNPNVLSAVWANGQRVKEVKVTKRAFQEEGGAFVTSEYARVAVLDGQGSLMGVGGAPSVYGRRRLASYVKRYRADGAQQEAGGEVQLVGVDRYVVEYLYPAQADKAVVALRYRDLLRRAV